MEIGYIKIIVTIVLIMIGWLVTHYFTSKRDFINKKREISIEHLINAYRILTNEISHREPTKENSIKLENLLADIQLFGSKKQIEMAKNLADELAKGLDFELDPLINDLRNDLRGQLNLSNIEDNVKWLRFN